MRQATFNTLRRIIYQRSGISIDKSKTALVKARIERRLQALRLENFEGYLHYLIRDPHGKEIEYLLNAVSTNLTNFYRAQSQFSVLHDVLGQWMSEGQTKFRLWSAACSTGQETYSMAMTLLECAGKKKMDWKILGTDISTDALRTASSGIFPRADVKRIPRDFLTKYFIKKGRSKEHHIHSQIRKNISFNRLNLAATPFVMKGPFDVIFCCNVMIYFDEPIKDRLIQELHRLLRPNGLLMVGQAERLPTKYENHFQNVHPSIYERRPSK